MRSILAIAAGFAAWTTLGIAANYSAMAISPESFDDDGTTSVIRILLLFLAAPAIFCLLSGWLTARLAPLHPVQHAMILGFVLLAIGIMAQIKFWAAMPTWYHLAFLGMLLPLTFAGGRLGRMRM